MEAKRRNLRCKTNTILIRHIVVLVDRKGMFVMKIFIDDIARYLGMPKSG